MAQRLGLAAALLGDPPVLILDEPVNGLDTHGIRWIRTTLRAVAAEGRTVLVSSHLMTEMELTADHLIVIGRLIADTDMRTFIETNSARHTLVRTAQADQLNDLLRRAGAHIQPEPADAWPVSGIDPAEISQIAQTTASRSTS
jgi:ABC-2 type transport system ATP-binding protein